MLVSAAAIFVAGAGCGDRDSPSVWLYNETDSRVIVTDETGFEVTVPPGERSPSSVGGRCVTQRLHVEAVDGTTIGDVDDEQMCDDGSSLYILGVDDFRVETR